MPSVGRDGQRCPRCDRDSYHPVDVMSGWCSACSAFTSSTAAEVEQAAATLRSIGHTTTADTMLWRLETYGATDRAPSPPQPV